MNPVNYDGDVIATDPHWYGDDQPATFLFSWHVWSNKPEHERHTRYEFRGTVRSTGARSTGPAVGYFRHEVTLDNGERWWVYEDDKSCAPVTPHNT